jgi:hypothetical protein
MLKAIAMREELAPKPGVDAEFEMSQDSAHNFMNVAERFGDQIPNCSEFRV